LFDEFLVTCAVAFEDVVDGSDESAEAISVKEDHSDVGIGYDVGCPGFVVDECQFPEVVSAFVLVDFLFWFSLGGSALAFLE
jgi:hypothetical protein